MRLIVGGGLMGMWLEKNIRIIVQRYYCKAMERTAEVGGIVGGMLSFRSVGSRSDERGRLILFMD